MALSYDPERIINTWAGILFQGVMDGTFVTVEFQEDDVSLHVGGQGHATFTENANKSAIVTITLAQSSITNDLLSAARGAKTKGPFLMKDLNSLTLVSGANARIQKMAPISYGKELAGREWKIIIPKCTAVAGGNP